VEAAVRDVEGYTVPEFAKMTGVTPGRVRQQITAGVVPAVKSGSKRQARWIIPRRAWDRICLERSNQALAEMKERRERYLGEQAAAKAEQAEVA
jgi:hypothetical protein